MSNYKIKVNNEAESREAQELFFELGYKWCDGKRVQFCWMIYLFVDEKGYITINGNDDDHFLSSNEKELTLPQLRDLVAQSKNEQGLISGADALRALADGDQVQWMTGDVFQDVTDEWQIREFSHPSFKFRLKPRTIKLELEIPAPFEPKVGDIYYYINSSNLKGYGFTKFANDGDDECLTFYGAWRTEEEIEQVVSALRGALK